MEEALSDWNAETAEWYAQNYGDYPTNQLGIDALDLPDHSRIVDIGCGTGAALRHATSRIKGGRFIGLDPVPRMIEIANEWTEDHDAKNRIEFRVGSAESLPIESNFADYVLAFDSIDHWQDVDQGLKEVGRILKATGKFVIIKDIHVPGADEAIEKLITQLVLAGFLIKVDKLISNDTIRFHLFICEIVKP